MKRFIMCIFITFHQKGLDITVKWTWKKLFLKFMTAWCGNAFCTTGTVWVEFASHWRIQSMVASPNRGPVMQRFDVFFVVTLNKLLNEQYSCLRCSCDVGWTPVAEADVMYVTVPTLKMKQNGHHFQIQFLVWKSLTVPWSEFHCCLLQGIQLTIHQHWFR